MLHIVVLLLMLSVGVVKPVSINAVFSPIVNDQYDSDDSDSDTAAEESNGSEDEDVSDSGCSVDEEDQEESARDSRELIRIDSPTQRMQLSVQDLLQVCVVTGNLQVLNVKSRKVFKGGQFSHNDQRLVLWFDADNRFTFPGDGIAHAAVLYVWNVRQGRYVPIRKFNLHDGWQVSNVFFDNDGELTVEATSASDATVVCMQKSAIVNAQVMHEINETDVVTGAR